MRNGGNFRKGGGGARAVLIVAPLLTAKLLRAGRKRAFAIGINELAWGRRDAGGGRSWSAHSGRELNSNCCAWRPRPAALPTRDDGAPEPPTFGRRVDATG